MHPSSMTRMKWFIDTYLANNTETKVLDVGSYDVNGTYRSLFSDSKYQYTGLDMVAGPNVDHVAENPYNWADIADDSFDLVISGQALEHSEFFWRTVSEMARVTKKQGLICIIVPRNLGLHRAPVDCYRFDQDGMIALARFACLEPLHASCDMALPGAGPEWYDHQNGDAMLVAKKPENWTGIVDYSTYKYQDADRDRLASGFIVDPKLVPPKNNLRRFFWKIRRKYQYNPKVWPF